MDEMDYDHDSVDLVVSRSRKQEWIFKPSLDPSSTPSSKFCVDMVFIEPKGLNTYLNHNYPIAKCDGFTFDGYVGEWYLIPV